MRNLIGLAVALAVASGAVADIIWDNNIEANGSYARAISPPGFPGNRAADDFDTRRGTLVIRGIRYAGVEDADWEWADGDGIEVTFYEHNGGPGDIIATRTAGGSKIATGETFFGRDAYIYTAEFEDEPVKLAWDRYWVGVRHPTARGSGSNYWLSSDGGPRGGGWSHAYFSLDEGNTWQQEVGPDWHHAFVLTGEFFCEPCDANCDGSIDLTDIEPFIELFRQRCSWCAGDTNEDGSIDLTDIEGFIECLLG